MYIFKKFTGKCDRRLPRNEGEESSVYMRENWLARDGRLNRPLGTVQAVDTVLTGIPTWEARYHSVETGIISPKSFAYTQDGKIWAINDLGHSAAVCKDGLNINAYPNHWLFKTQTQTKMYFVDGYNLYKYDGNNANLFEKVTITDTDGASINPIDVIEHRDRLFLISDTYLYISKNLEPDNFSDATDSIQIIVGSGKGKNKALRKIGDRLYILNTEGKFALNGDTISAVASTFELVMVEDKHPIIAGRTAVNVEGAINYLADDLNIWQFNGVSSKKLTHFEKLEDFVFNNRAYLDKAVATYYNNYYMLSFVENASTYNNLEIWWDAVEDKCDFVRGRNVSCYMQTDPSMEPLKQQLCRSDAYTVMDADNGYNFAGSAIVSKLWTKDITPKVGYNVRFRQFFPEIEPLGTRNITINYILDGQLTPNANWSQSLEGVTKTLGLMTFQNQSQATYAINPKINYSRGQSIAFYVSDATKDLRTTLLGIGIDFIPKFQKKGRLVGE